VSNCQYKTTEKNLGKKLFFDKFEGFAEKGFSESLESETVCDFYNAKTPINCF